MHTSVSESTNYKTTAPTFNKVLKKTSANGKARVLPEKLAQLKCWLQNRRSSQAWKDQVLEALDEVKNQAKPGTGAAYAIEVLESRLRRSAEVKFKDLRSFLNTIHDGLKHQKQEATIQQTISQNINSDIPTDTPVEIVPEPQTKKSSSIRPDDTRKDHYWEYKSGKAGGVHDAGKKGGVHALKNAKNEFVDLDGNVLNVLSADGQATDVVNRKFTVLRDSSKQIIEVIYDDGLEPDKLAVEMDKAGQNLITKYGGVVIAKLDKPQLALIKQEPNVAKTMTEYIGSVVFRSRHPDSFPEVHLVDTSNNENARKATDIYVASVYIKDYKCDLYKDIFKRNGHLAPKAKPTLFGMTSKSQEEIRQAFVKDDESHKPYIDFEKATVPALRGGEFDMHTGNIGIKGDNELVRIDLAGTWRKICQHTTLGPHSNKAHPIGMGPTNRFAQYDVSLKLNAKFVAELDADVDHDYQPSIEKALMDLTTNFYDADSFRELADWVGIDANELPRASDGSITNDCQTLAMSIAANVVKAYDARGTDMSRFSAQLKSDLCATSAKKNAKGELELGSYKDVNGKMISFEEVVIKHQGYFREVIDGTQEFKFRDKAHANDKGLVEAVRNKAKTTLDQLALVQKKNLAELLAPSSQLRSKTKLELQKTEGYDLARRVLASATATMPLPKGASHVIAALGAEGYTTSAQLRQFCLKTPLLGMMTLTAAEDLVKNITDLEMQERLSGGIEVQREEA